MTMIVELIILKLAPWQPFWISVATYYIRATQYMQAPPIECRWK